MNADLKPTVLQRIELHPRDDVASLHFTVSSDTAILDMADNPVQGRTFPAGARVDFDSLFGSFYESDWYGYTDLQNVLLQLEVEGVFSAKVFRRTLKGDQALLAEIRSDEGGNLYRIGIAKPDGVEQIPARMWFEIQAETDIAIRDLAWVTFDQPHATKVTLGVCFTSFNRLPYLRRAVNELLENDEAGDSIGKIFIVNQGKRFTITELVLPENRGRADVIEIIEQDNFGGCGGFTRGILQAMEDDRLSHILLCDDDIDFDSHSIVRLASFMQFCRDDVAVGGQMLDILHPQVLYESGACLDQETLLAQSIGRGLDLTDNETLDYLIDTNRADYNAWWYFAFSKTIVEKVALPMPCFIRGDDVEYGIRMKHCGIHTVVLPGLVVWHEPFYNKPMTWQAYYGTKNRLLLQMLHFDRGFWRNYGHIWGQFIGELMKCRYHIASMMLQAFSDFIRGAEFSMTCDPNRFAEIRHMAASRAPKEVVGEGALTRRCQEDPARPRKRHWWWDSLAFVASSLALARKKRTTCYLDEADLTPISVIGAKEFIVRDSGGRRFIRYVRSWRTFSAMFWQFLWLMIRLRLRYSRLRNHYQSEFGSYTGEGHWRKLLGIDVAP